MAIKMAENSLFAILLRSPWWYSAAAGLLVIALAMAIARGSYQILGISLSLPFFGIAAYAAFKQSLRPSVKQIAEVAAQARQMTAPAVAEKIATNYTRERFESAAFSGAEAELELTRGHRKILVSSKRFKAANTGVEPLKKLIAAGERVDATGYLYVTLGEVSSNSLEFARENNIEFIRANDLAEYFSDKAKIQ